MGSNYKSYGGGKCGCSKRVKKAQRVPQRGPGVAELEKILSDQKQDHVKQQPLYNTPNGPSLYNQPHFHLMRPAAQHPPMHMMPPPPPPPPPLPSHFPHSQHFGGSGNNVYVKPWRSDGAMKADQLNSSNEPMLSFTQMMMMSDPQDSKPNSNPVFQPNINSSYPSADAPHTMTHGANLGLNHFNQHCSSQRFYTKCPPPFPLEEDKYATQKAGGEMPSRPHSFHAQQVGQASVENGRPIAERERMILRNILTLGPPSPTKGPSSLPLNPISIESDSSDEQCKDMKQEDSSNKCHQSQIFGFNLQEKKYLSLDDTKLSLHYKAAQAEELSLDLTLKL